MEQIPDNSHGSSMSEQAASRMEKRRAYREQDRQQVERYTSAKTHFENLDQPVQEAVTALKDISMAEARHWAEQEFGDTWFGDEQYFRHLTLAVRNYAAGFSRNTETLLERFSDDNDRVVAEKALEIAEQNLPFFSELTDLSSEELPVSSTSKETEGPEASTVASQELPSQEEINTMSFNDFENTKSLPLIKAFQRSAMDKLIEVDKEYLAKKGVIEEIDDESGRLLQTDGVVSNMYPSQLLMYSSWDTVVDNTKQTLQKYFEA